MFSMLYLIYKLFQCKMVPPSIYMESLFLLLLGQNSLVVNTYLASKADSDFFFLLVFKNCEPLSQNV